MTLDSTDTAKKSCAILLVVDFYSQTLPRLIEFFAARGIALDSLHLQAGVGEEALISIHCRIERDRIKHTQASLEKLVGVLQLDLMESRRTHLIKI